MGLDKLIRKSIIVAALAVPAYGCEGDTTNVYEGNGGSEGSGDYTCKNICYEKLPEACPSPDWVDHDSEDCKHACLNYTSDDSSKVKAYFECVMDACSNASSGEHGVGEKCAKYY